MSNKINNVPQHKTLPSTPATPDSGYAKIYIKSDKLWYGLDDAGVETLLSGGGSGIGGSGTADYVARWTPDGATLNIGLIRDDNTGVGINTAPNPSATVAITSNTSAGLFVSSNTIPSNGSSIKNGISINVSGALSDNRGIDLSVSSGTTSNTGINAAATGTAGTTTWGAIFSAQGDGTKYSVRLADGTNATNKFLKSVTASGDANWANITAADVSGVQGSLTLTTTGSSGAATLIGNTLNIPQYSGGGGGGLSGSGTLNYLSKWTPDGVTLGNSKLREDSITAGITSNLLFDNTTKFQVETDTTGIAIIGLANHTPATLIGQVVGVLGSINGHSTYYGQPIGGQFEVSALTGATNHAFGVVGRVNISSSAFVAGAKFQVENNGSGSAHSVVLIDGTETVSGGKFLKDTGDGKANWSALPTASAGTAGVIKIGSGLSIDGSGVLSATGGGGGVSGSGTLNYLTKWTPDGLTLGKSDIIENSTYQIGIGESPYTSAKVNIRAFDEYEGISIRTTAATGSRAIGAFANGQNSTGDNYGIFAQANGNTGSNVGIYAQGSAKDALSESIGGEFEAKAGTQLNPSASSTIAIGISAYAIAYGGTAYFAKFNKHGVSPLDKVVLSDNSQGYADWGKVTSSYTDGASGTFTSADGKTITVTNGLITSIV